MYTWADGRRYEGEYVNEKKEGFGCYYWPDGKSYEGQWLNGKQHGEGRFTNTKGRSKLGVWENGERTHWIDAKSSMIPSKLGTDLSVVGRSEQSPGLRLENNLAMPL